MTSRILQEGILDVKAPRGSEDRKLWKVWRFQWICFSVVYPSGRREPYLVLDLANSTSKTSHRQITVSRDGLRVFRCTSKSRPLRTWAIMSGEKPLLYFAADSELRAQEWMQSLRDGLWPPCFSFQMLTACSHEVSLIDDENTFLSGLLGVYGRLVLTTGDVISLIHPHWGAALLQISLANIKDVLLVREAEVPPAGVFRIALKCVEDSKVKALYFYSATAMEAIQWILGKVLTKCVLHSNQPAKRKLTKCNSDSILSSAKSLLAIEDEHVNISDSAALHCTGKDKPGEQSSLIDFSDGHKTLKSLDVNSVQNPLGSSTVFSNNSLNFNEYAIVRKQTSKEIPKLNVAAQTSEDECLVDISANTDDLKNKTAHFNFLEEVFLKNIEQGKEISSNTEMSWINDFRKSSNFANSNSDYENMKFLNENFVQTKNSSVEHIDDALNSVNYIVMDGRNSKDLPQRNAKAQTSGNGISKDAVNINENNPPSKSNLKNSYVDNVTLSTSSIECIHKKIASLSSSSLNEINSSPSISNKTSEFSIKCPKIRFAEDTNESKILSKNSPSSDACSSEYRKKDTNTEIMPSLTDVYCTDSKSETEKSCLLLNMPSDFLNTSISSVRLNNKSNGSLSSEEDIETPMPWTADEFQYLGLDDSSDHVYEALSQRKGTVYEEIDESDGDEIVPHLPPQLPHRPKNLEIPSTLRLKKLSDSINATLNLMETQPSSARHINAKFIKKIKETNRVMYISRNREIESRLEEKFLSEMNNISISEPSSIRSLDRKQNCRNEKKVRLNTNSITSTQP